MCTLSDFLRRLLNDGQVVFHEPPRREASQTEKKQALDFLEEAFCDYRLEVAGAVIPFAADIALAASELVWHASWLSVSRQEAVEEVEARLHMPGRPSSAAEHLNADLLLRYLPQVHSRARARDPADSLTTRLAQVLREWPLSGVLADLPEAPLTPLEFGGHPGLLMLYAERLAARERPAWLPADGPARDYVALVWQELGRGEIK